MHANVVQIFYFSTLCTCTCTCTYVWNSCCGNQSYSMYVCVCVCVCVCVRNGYLTFLSICVKKHGTCNWIWPTALSGVLICGKNANRPVNYIYNTLSLSLSVRVRATQKENYLSYSCQPCQRWLWWSDLSYILVYVAWWSKWIKLSYFYKSTSVAEQVQRCWSQVWAIVRPFEVVCRVECCSAWDVLFKSIK